MTTNRVLDKFGASTAFTITLASLATGAAAARQSDMVDISSLKEQYARLFIKLKQGTPTGNRQAYIYLLLGDGHATPHRTDGAGASDAALTIINAPLIGTLKNLPSPSAGENLYGEFLVRIAAPSFGIAISHDTASNLDSTAGNHWARYILLGPDVQAAA